MAGLVGVVTWQLWPGGQSSLSQPPDRPALMVDGRKVTVVRDGGEERLFPEGRITAAAFMTARCPACRRDATRAVELLRRIPANRKLVVSVGLADDSTRRLFRPLLDEGIQYARLMDEADRDQLGLQNVPLVAIVDENRHLRLTYTGIPQAALPDRDSLRTLLKSTGLR